ncbi:MAG: putative polysaccharide biosynthesis protein [Oscillospiraceae bacterium]|jgi:stage V sporulation protein B
MAAKHTVKKRAARQQSLVEGGVILALASVIVKIIGAIYKIPLIAVIGTDGNGFYTYAYNIYLVIYAMTVSGIPTAISRIVAELRTHGRYKDIKRLKKVSYVLMLIIGLIGSAVLFSTARLYAEETLKVPLAYYSILAVAPSILFSCLMATHRGYSQGLRNMTPTAVSQIIEVLVKVASGLSGAYIIGKRLSDEYRAFGTMFGQGVPVGTKPEVLASAYTSAMAIGGVTISVFAGWIYMLIRDAVVSDGITKEQIASSPDSFGFKALAKKILSISIPIALSSATVYLAGFIDGITVTDRLINVFEEHGRELFASYGGLLEKAGKSLSDDASEIANFLYGAYGLSSPLFNLIPGITGAFGISAMPHITVAWEDNNVKLVKKNTESVLRLTMVIAAPLGCGICALAAPITRVLYASRNSVSSEIVYPIVGVLGLVSILVAVTSSLTSVLQGVGRIDMPVKLMALGAFLKVALNYILVGIPELNIKALALDNAVCYALIVILSFVTFKKTTGIKISYYKVMIKPLMAGAGCGLAAWAADKLLLKVLVGRTSVCLLLSIIVGAVMYFVFMGLLKAVEEEDVLSLPGGAKLAKLLKKIHVL